MSQPPPPSEDYYEKGQVPSLDRQGGRVGIHPAEVKGIWKNRKSVFQFLLLLLLLIGPWTQFAGQQTILLDIPSRKFTFFGVTLWAHEAPLVFLVLILFTLGLFFVTAIWGRIWCGWACPQTVFIEAVYRRLEIWIEGNYIARRKMQKESWTPQVYMKKILKWLSYFAVSSVIAHSVAAYFVGSHELLKMMAAPPAENLSYFVIITSVTLLLLFNFGWFREQFCIIMCPYGRMQSVLLDSDSLVVLYDTARGEPRKGSLPPDSETKVGDCVACRRCVQVCPTGIDIRHGLQMECIACTACIDVCDDMMTKMKRPKGLIRYGTQSGQKVSPWRPRSLVYIGLFLVFFLILTFLLNSRKPIDVTLVRAAATPFQIMTDDTGQKLLLNHFVAHIKNQSSKEISVRLSIDPLKWGSGLVLTTPQNPLILSPGDNQNVHLFIKYFEPWDLKQGQKLISIQLNEVEKEVTLLGETP